MADEIRSKLAGLPGLEVIARGSSSQYLGSGKTPAQIAAELGAPYLLTGTVRWEKGPKRSRVRVSPELIEASTGVTRWARPFDAAFTDVFAVQADIAGQVAGALHLALTDSARAQLSAVPTRSLDAYARYLRSRELRSGESTPEVLRAAIAELREAVRLDTGFVAAWAELAQAQMDVFRQGGLMVSDADSARASLHRAGGLAPASPDVLAASARYHLGVEGDFAAALHDYREALRGAPHRTDLLIGAGTVEMELNRWPEAVADLEHAARLDPRSPDAAFWIGSAYLRLRRYDDARRELDRARGLRPASLSLGYARARLAAAEGDLPGVRRVFAEHGAHGRAPRARGLRGAPRGPDLGARGRPAPRRDHAHARRPRWRSRRLGPGRVRGPPPPGRLGPLAGLRRQRGRRLRHDAGSAGAIGGIAARSWSPARLRSRWAGAWGTHAPPRIRPASRSRSARASRARTSPMCGAASTHGRRPWLGHGAAPGHSRRAGPAVARVVRHRSDARSVAGGRGSRS